MPREAHRFVTLDGLRGIAAFAIVATHAGNAVPFEIPRPFLAVDFFFALSGFVLCHAYADRFRVGLSPRAFLLVRLVRLYPLYILGTAIGIMLWLTAGDAQGFRHPAVDIAAAVLFLPSPSSAMLYPFDYPAWSLFWELVTNTAWAALGTRLTGWILYAVVAAAAGALAAYAMWLGSLDTSNGWEHFEGGFFRAGFSFFVGVLLHRIWQNRPAPANLAAIVLGAILLVLLLVPMPQQVEAAYEAGLVLVAFPLLIWFGASSTPTASVAIACTWLGEISYAVYVLHAPIIAGITRPHILRGATKGLVLLVAIVAAAHLATRFFDRPVRRRLTAWLGLNSSVR